MSPRRSIFPLAALFVLLGEPPRSVCAEATAAPETAEADENRKHILSALRETQQKYGSDAVLVEGHLLGQAVRSGSILEAEISIPGVRERDGKRFLELRLQTGIVYNDRTVSGAQRLRRLWTDLVEPTLRKFQSVSAPADGLLFRLDYSHKDYADEAALRAGLSAADGRGTAESAAFFMLLSDIADLNAKRLTARQFLDQSVVLVDGAAVAVGLEDPTAVAR